MKSINSCDIELGNSDIPISVYSAIEKETSFKQISTCCNSAVNYKKVCSSCNKELQTDEIKKALAVGDELKQIDTEKLKVENSNLKILGVVNEDNEENLFYNGDVWFIAYQKEKKNKGKNERNLLKFSYFRESLRTSGKVFLGVVNVRGKEHLVVLKPYFKALVGLGIYHFNQIRDVKELLIEDFSVDTNVVNQMVEQIKMKENINLNTIENKRELLIENALSDLSVEKEEKKTENPLELVCF